MRYKAITKITPQDVSETQKWYAQDRLNTRRLESCPGPHDFLPESVSTIVPGMVRSYKCRKCQGELGPVSRAWYEQGLKHGGKAQ